MKFLVIGENCLDVFVYGECDRLCPEAPVPIIKPKMKVTNQGMAGNVIKNLESLDNNLEVVGVHQKEKIIKTRLVDGKTNHMFIRVDEENIVDKIEIDENFLELIRQSDVVIVSDYDKGFLSSNDLIIIGKNSKLSILDSKKILKEEVVDSYCFVKLNESEFNKNSEFKDKQNIIVTLGSKGCMYQGEIFESPNPMETIDVSGAGDTFTASFIWKFWETLDIFESLNYANKVASIVVSKRGVSIPY